MCTILVHVYVVTMHELHLVHYRCLHVYDHGITIEIRLLILSTACTKCLIIEVHNFWANVCGNTGNCPL